MPRISTFAGALLAAACLASPAGAHDYTLGSLRIVHPWSRATPPGAKVAGGFLKIENNGTTPDRLIGGTLPAAGRFEVHVMAMEGGVMTMRQLDKGLEIPPGQTVELKPGSFHLMFMDMKSSLTEGERVKGTLVFEKAGTVVVDYKIEAIGAKTSGKGAKDASPGPAAAGHDMSAHGAGHGTMDHSGHTPAAQPVKTP